MVQSELKHSRLWYGIAYAMLLLVAVVSLMPAPDLGVGDKNLHFITYFLLSSGFVTLNQKPSGLWKIFTGLVCYGILIELLQGMTGYRFMEAYDVLANSIGALCGLILWLTPIPSLFRELESAF